MSKKNDYQGPNFLSFLEKGVEALVGKLFSKANFSVFPDGELERRWEEIENLDPKYSIIEGDKLVDNVLRRAGLQGNSMADRLRNTQKLIPRKVYEDMWTAHKLRNQLVHEVDYQLRVEAAVGALWKMKKYLITLGAFKDE
jgi:hypothetical protein